MSDQPKGKDKSKETVALSTLFVHPSPFNSHSNEEWSEELVETQISKWFWGLLIVAGLYCLSVIAFIL